MALVSSLAPQPGPGSSVQSLSDHGGGLQPGFPGPGRAWRLTVPSGMSALQPGLALNENQAGRARRAWQAAASSSCGLGRAAWHGYWGGHTLPPAWAAGALPATSGQRLPEGGQGRS